MQAIDVEIAYLKSGQNRIENGMHGLSGKLDGVVDALTSLVRLSEQHHALNDRVTKIETRNSTADKTATRGISYMNMALWAIPLLIGASIGFGKWAFNSIEEHTVAITRLEMKK
jgi:hypothetical protein